MCLSVQCTCGADGRVASFPGLSGEGKAWGLLRAHARKLPFIFRIIRRKISGNDVIVHGESSRKECADIACIIIICLLLVGYGWKKAMPRMPQAIWQYSLHRSIQQCLL